ncbi:hypothetical protein S100072_03204 [Bacillus velezensis]|nr:hypothetical protein S100072_03204 [Bacillus velezensis]
MTKPYSLRAGHFFCSYLKIFLSNLLVAFPAALRAILFPSDPFLAALTSPKILADLYSADLILFKFIPIVPYYRFISAYIRILEKNSGRHPHNTHKVMINYDLKREGKAGNTMKPVIKTSSDMLRC